MAFFASARAWIEILASDFLRQRCQVFGDRVAAYCPDEAYVIPKDLRQTRTVCACVDAEALAKLRVRCREKEVTFHSLLAASLLVAYSKERAVRHPPEPFTTERVFRAVLLFLVALITTFLSATGGKGNKVMNCES